ncbi:type II secretion system F family protein [Paenibacillus hexagrammi]|uniref:Type II secretion protein F n=1 Tax=Paenibacillus hexagrammi TaxID=2908839 RepID=A0ABY3SPP5_9BACL|nr:type II secretion protein F [Paenibacillus sp. YPD9-1]UJF35954.1 type II secretion protein F [Paenibacillus sp. YPD9-1]
MWITILAGIEASIGIALFLVGRRRYAVFLKEQTYPFQLRWMLPCSLLLVDVFNILERMPDFTSKVHHKLLTLYGRGYSLHGSKIFTAELVSAAFLSLMFFTILAAAAGQEASLFAMGLLTTGIVPMLMVRDLDVKIRKKQQLMIMELPEVLNTIVLLVNAGETVGKAWIRCVEARKNRPETPLFKELSTAVRGLEMNLSFPKVMEDFSKRCALHEISLFTSALLLNYKRGGNDFAMALQALSLELWQRRKAVSRTLGEEASSKLVFPMVLIFVVVMVIVASPALMIMKQ